MQIVILRDLNPDKGLVCGAIRDWPRQVITEMSQQIGDKDWFSYDAGMIRSLGRTAAREQLRPEIVVPQEAPQAPALGPNILEPMTTAEAILADQDPAHRVMMGEVPRAQRGPGRPRKEPALVPA